MSFLFYFYLKNLVFGHFNASETFCRLQSGFFVANNNHYQHVAVFGRFTIRQKYPQQFILGVNEK
jgi:hypothetical protein